MNIKISIRELNSAYQYEKNPTVRDLYKELMDAMLETKQQEVEINPDTTSQDILFWQTIKNIAKAHTEAKNKLPHTPTEKRRKKRNNMTNKLPLVHSHMYLGHQQIGFYIVRNKIEYLWKDGTWHKDTGLEWKEPPTHLWDAPGFWKTREEASQFLNAFLQKEDSNRRNTNCGQYVPADGISHDD